MTIRHLAPSFIIFVLLTQPLLLFGQNKTDQGNWASVTALPAGSSLRVDTKSKKRFEGTLKLSQNKPAEIARVARALAERPDDGSRQIARLMDKL